VARGIHSISSGVSATPSAVDGTISTGASDASISRVAGALGAVFAGSAGASDAVTNRQATLPTGASGASLTIAIASGVGARSAGTSGSSVSASASGTVSLAYGSSGASLAANTTATGTGYTATATNTRNTGAKDWATPTNAQGAFDASVTTISAAATASAADAFDATLKCSGFPIGAAPSGYTRTNVSIAIRHQWDLDVGVLSTASSVVTLRSSVGAVLATIVNRTSGTQPTLLTETFDVTASVAALSDAQLATCVVWCDADCNLLIITGGNASWSITGVHMLVTYTNSGIA
jgi:trimeric autotransporter adhesin